MYRVYIYFLYYIYLYVFTVNSKPSPTCRWCLNTVSSRSLGLRRRSNRLQDPATWIFLHLCGSFQNLDLLDLQSQGFMSKGVRRYQPESDRPSMKWRILCVFYDVLHHNPWLKNNCVVTPLKSGYPAIQKIWKYGTAP